MRPHRRLPSAAALLASVACTPAPPPPPARPAVEAAPPTEHLDPPVEPEEAINRSAGEELTLDLPLADGTTVSLTSLRGSVVVVAVAATWESSWPALWSALDGLAAREGVHAFAIASDPDPVRGGATSAVRLGWDPQGAVSARLRVARYPTVVVVDGDGRIAAVVHDAEATEAAVHSALGGAPSPAGTSSGAKDSTPR